MNEGILETLKLSLQYEISSTTPSLYGKDGLVQLIQVVAYTITFFMSLTEILSHFMKKRSCRYNAQLIFLQMITFFSLVKLLILLIPIPWNNLTYLLISDQLPRYCVFLAFQFLAIWLGTAVFSSFARNRSTKNWIAVIIIVLFILLMIASVILSIFQSSRQDGSHTLNILLGFVNMISYGTIMISILIYSVRLLHISCRLKLEKAFKQRIIALLIVIAATFLIFTLRFIHNLFALLQKNKIIVLFETLFDSAVLGKKRFASSFFCGVAFDLIFDILPIYLLFAEYFILSLHSRHQRHQRRKNRTATYKIKRGKRKKRQKKKLTNESDPSSTEESTTPGHQQTEQVPLIPKRASSQKQRTTSRGSINSSYPVGTPATQESAYFGDNQIRNDQTNYSPDFSIND
ncbi:hypothetical protein BLNAU_7792 [Blattamonas nauphoetae]|uniref:Transmembrane protein n=1 Tax=Blattamonas nauphoetae TaxID=2049346 RepID=A0ABQ9Y0C9_9EUKA|nr:hypothetical protein BLNAU_7792 [Blattamonas nauphoetae]